MVVQTGPHTRVHQRTVRTTLPGGKVVERKSSYTELATGLNRLGPDGLYHPASARLELTPRGAEAPNAACPVRLPGDIAEDFGVELATGDGLLRSHPVGLSYYDPVDGRRVTLATVRSAQGWLVGANTVIYSNCLAGAAGDIRYSVSLAGLEQDLILHEAPADPLQFGLSAESRLEFATEFDPRTPEPGRSEQVLRRQADPVRRQAMAEPDFTDTTLTFGRLRMVPGRAFTGDATGRNRRAEAGVRVGKSFETRGGRKLLLEAVEHRDLGKLLRHLPAQRDLQASRAPGREAAAGVAVKGGVLPGRPAGLARPGAVIRMAQAAPLDQPRRLAGLEPSGEPGAPVLVMDYTTVLNGLQDVTFGSETYLVSSGAWLRGTTRILPGAVVKFGKTEEWEYPQLLLDGPMECRTEAYRMAAFTSRNDDSIGETILERGLDMRYDQALTVIAPAEGPIELKYLRIAHAWCALSTANWNDTPGGLLFRLRHSQIVDSTYGIWIEGGGGQLENVLMTGMGEAGFYGSQYAATATHLTLDGCPVLADDYVNPNFSTLVLTNSLLVAVTNCPIVPATNHVAWLGAETAPFQTVGAGSHYLADDSICRGSGTTNIPEALAEALAAMTTHPPVVLQDLTLATNLDLSPQVVRSSGSRDLGYHYAPLDYACGGVLLSATLRLLPGTAVAWFESDPNWIGFGLRLTNGAKFLSEGSPMAPCWFVRYNTVQECANTNWNRRGCMGGILEDGSGPGVPPEISARFTKWSGFADDPNHFRDNWNDAISSFTHCEFYSGAVYSTWPARYFTNCLFEGVFVNFDGNGQISPGVNFAFRNCLFHGGEVWLTRSNAQTPAWTIQDSVFDGTTNTINDALQGDTNYTCFSFNAFSTNATRLSPQSPSDLVLPGFDWQAGPLGNYYLPSNSPLVSIGSVSAAAVGLFHWTTQTNQTKEENSQVDRSYHYVALNVSGRPVDSEADGLADVLEDGNGDGVIDAGETGQEPLCATNLEFASSWSLNSVRINSTNPASLRYAEAGVSGVNLNCRVGSVSFWFAPDWASAAAGGVGPVAPAVLLALGQWSTNAAYGYWAVTLSAEGDTLALVTQDAGITTTNLTCSNAWTLTNWHHLALTYSESNSTAYLDGVAVVTNGLGVAHYPSAAVRALGFGLGSDAQGGSQARGRFDELSTYNYPLDPSEVYALYAASLAPDFDGDGLTDSQEMNLSHTDPANPASGANGLCDAYQDPDGDGWTTLQEIQNGTDPITFNAPLAPFGLVAHSDAPFTSVTLKWQIPPSPSLLGFELERQDPGGSFAWLASPSPEARSYVDASTAATNGQLYRLRAAYGSNLYSAWAAAVFVNYRPGLVPDLTIVRGPAGRPHFVITTPLDDLETVELVFYYYDTGSILAWTLDVPASDFVGGGYRPTTAELPQELRYGRAVRWQAKDKAGNLGPASLADYTCLEHLSPFWDGSQHLRQNAAFLLREANPYQTFQANRYQGCVGREWWHRYPEDYVYAGYHTPNDGFLYRYYHARPFYENALWRNLAFDLSCIDTNGFFATGAWYREYRPPPFFLVACDYGDAWGLVGALAYSNSVAVLSCTNPSSLPTPLLGESETEWLLAGPLDHAGVTLQTDNPPYGYAYSLGAQVTNRYGLPLESAKVLGLNWWYAPTGWHLATVPAGSTVSVTNKRAHYWYAFQSSAQPALETVGFYFGRQSADVLSGPTDTQPDSSAFSITNTTPYPFVVGLGQSLALAGWSKERVVNGAPDKFAYVEQYFDQVFRADDYGYRTTNTTGVLSEYGEFLPTEPGRVVLTTKTNAAGGEMGECLVNVIGLAVDANRDGTNDLHLGGPDATSAERPFAFWVNNDTDRDHPISGALGGGREEDDLAKNDSQAGCRIDPNPTLDCDYKEDLYTYAIPCKRDLEDYTRLWIPGLAALYTAHTNLTLELSVRNNDTTDGPALNLFLAAETNGGTNYLHDTNVADVQISQPTARCVGRVGPNGSTVHLDTFFYKVNEARDYFIFCGAKRGKGELVLTVKNGTAVLAETSLWLQLKDIKEMYERWTVGDTETVRPVTTPYLAVEDLPAGVPAFQYAQPDTTNVPYILHVHGWNMERWDKDRFAETMFKRLYWQGYRGRFGSFRWPTFERWPYHEKACSYDKSEEQAWRSGEGLRNLLVGLNAQYPGQVRLTAHSMGNVVAGEALRTNTILVEAY